MLIFMGKKDKIIFMQNKNDASKSFFQSIKTFLKKEIMLCVALLAAIISLL